MKDLLEKFETRVTEIEKKRSFLSKAERLEFEDTVIDILAKAVHECIRQGNIFLRDIIEKCDEVIVKEGFQFFRDQLQALIYQSIFAARSFEKPRGYAGDFEMMNLIYRNESYGPSLFARVMERAMQLHPEPHSLASPSDQNGTLMSYGTRPATACVGLPEATQPVCVSCAGTATPPGVPPLATRRCTIPTL